MRKHKKISTGQTTRFNNLAREAHRNKTIYIDSFASRHELETVLSFMPNLAGSSVLDIGCGIGRFAIPIAKIAKLVVGIDTSSESIKLLRANAKKEHVQNISASVMDFHDLPTTKKFDYVLLVNVVHHIPDVRGLLSKTRDVLRKNGTVVIFEFNPLNVLYIPFFILYKQVLIHVNREYLRSNIWSLGKILDRAGYYVVRSAKYAFLPTALYNVSPVFLKVNTMLNSIPVLNIFSAFHIVAYKLKNHE